MEENEMKIENKAESLEESSSPIDQESYALFVGLRFNDAGKSYFFATNDESLKVGDEVIVETVRGLELGKVSTLPLPLTDYHLELELKPILRRATDTDLRLHDENVLRAKESFAICQAAIQDMQLDMNLISCEYTLDRTKVIFSYLANDRVDFRDLLKVLAAKLKCRIELRQIGTRDKAKIIGGIGVCGLPLCCSTFLNEFDGISINRAKNQLLSLNIPKLSGHCGKLICCLKYEDDDYSILRKDFPKIGLRVVYNHELYRITSMNVLTKMIKLEKADDVQFLTLDEVNQLLENMAKNANSEKERKEE